MSISLSYIYSNIRVVTNADDTVRSTFCVSVIHFKINDFLLYMRFICIILENFSFSWVICIVFFFTSVVVRYTVAAETLADGLNTCCPPTPREETIQMSMLCCCIQRNLIPISPISRHMSYVVVPAREIIICQMLQKWEAIAVVRITF